MKLGFSFAFDPPVGWSEFKEGNAIGFNGPNGEELMVSANTIAGSGTREAMQRLLARLKENALETMKETADEAGLVVGPMMNMTNASGLEVWTLRGRTSDNVTIFMQATVVAPDGVMLVTMETPTKPGIDDEFDDFLNRIAVAPAPTEG